MYAMMAMGLTLVYGLLRILHIAHAGVFTLGAYIGVVVANTTGSLLLATALAVIVSGAVGVLIYRWAYQPLLGHPAFVPMIVSIGLFNNYVEPTMGAVVSYKTLAIIVLGGLGNVPGTLIASLVLGVVEAFGTIYLSHLLDRDAIGFLFLILALMVRPEGLVRRA